MLSSNKPHSTTNKKIEIKKNQNLHINSCDDFADFSSKPIDIESMNWNKTTSSYGKSLLGSKNSYNQFNNYDSQPTTLNIRVEDVRSLHNHLRFLSEDNIRRMNDTYIFNLRLAEEIIALGITINKTFENKSKFKKLMNNELGGL